MKRQRISEWRKKQDPTICYLLETHFKYKDTNELKVKEWEKICHANTSSKKVGLAVLISDQIDFREKIITGIIIS